MNSNLNQRMSYSPKTTNMELWDTARWPTRTSLKANRFIPSMILSIRQKNWPNARKLTRRYRIGRIQVVSGDRNRPIRKSTKVISNPNWQNRYKSLKKLQKTRMMKSQKNSQKIINWAKCTWIESFRKVQHYTLTLLSYRNLFFVKKWEKNRIVINNAILRNYPNIPIRKDSKKLAHRHRLITLIPGHLQINLLRFLILKKRIPRWCFRILVWVKT